MSREFTAVISAFVLVTCGGGICAGAVSAEEMQADSFSSVISPTSLGSEQWEIATDSLDQSDSVAFYGDLIDPALAHELEVYASSNSIDLGAELAEDPGSGLTFYKSSRGGVEVPGNYIYNPSLGGLHDYCTNAPDQFPAPGLNADFSGACARHDMCYERTSRSNHQAMRRCDSGLLSDLQRVCRATYTSSDPRRGGCLNIAKRYYQAVVAWHFNHIWSK